MELQQENTPMLQTERLILRRFTAEDAPAMLVLLKDKETNTFLPWFPMETLEQAQAFLQERFLHHYQLPSSYQYAICYKQDNIPIGYITLSEGENHDFGYGLRKEFWHKGIVTEACKAVVKHLEKVGFPYITATHDVYNPRSGGVMQQLGMIYRYSYREWVQPKNQLVTFRLYQLDFAEQNGWVYQGYLENALDGCSFTEKGIS